MKGNQFLPEHRNIKHILSARYNVIQWNEGLCASGVPLIGSSQSTKEEGPKCTSLKIKQEDDKELKR